MLRANHQLVKVAQDGCQSLFYIICDNPTKVDATGHHHNVISKALSFQSLALPPTTLAPATLFSTSPLHGCDLYGPANATHMQHTCNTHATHMQHTCNTHATHMQHEHFPCKFPSNVAAGAKIYTFHSKTGVGAANVKSCTLTVNLQVKSSCCMSCCMCVACVLHVRCMAGVQDRAVTLSKWRACHAERQPVHPTTLRNQVKKVSRLSLHVFHLAQPILAHMRPRKQTDTPTHTNTRPNWSRCFPWHSVVITLAFVCSHGSILLCLFWVGEAFFLFRVQFNCCWYACGCRSAHIHTHTHIDATTSASEIYALSKHALL